MKDILPPLLVTLALEVPVAALWGLRRSDLALCVLVNLLTNPLVNLLHLFFPSVWVLLALECAAVAAEGTLYRSLGHGVRKPFGLSITANAVSFLLGGAILFFLRIYFWRWLV
ncbi:MAG TPA: hypothetical protein VN421_11055 [Pseudoflavonifractor sp.]|nr:hypothetical protein [Pseudoflavonifractor sp.]